MAHDDVVLFEMRDEVALLTLNRPDRLNAWNGDLERGLFDLLDRCATDAAVKAIVVTGAGRGWCAGADMDVLQGIGGDTSGERARDAAAPRRQQWHTTTIPKPVIAAINGACAGIGLVQALMCDLRFAAAGAKFTTAFARRGLVAEHGMSWILPRLVGPAHALDLLLSGRVVLAEEAVTMGLVNRVVPAEHLLDETLAYAQDLATWSSPASMAVMKRQVWTHYDLDLAEATAASGTLMARSLMRTTSAKASRASSSGARRTSRRWCRAGPRATELRRRCGGPAGSGSGPIERPRLAWRPVSAPRLSSDDVAHVARLARLALTPEEIDRATHQLAGVLDHFADIDALDLSEVVPMTQPYQLQNVFRDDVVGPCLDRDEVLAAAPSAVGGRFRVPPILGEAP